MNAVGPCWSGFCIASVCNGTDHVDATGYNWHEVRPDNRCPITGVDDCTVRSCELHYMLAPLKVQPWLKLAHEDGSNG